MESKVAKPARLQELIVIILECTRFNYFLFLLCNYNIAAKFSVSAPSTVYFPKQDFDVPIRAQLHWKEL